MPSAMPSQNPPAKNKEGTNTSNQAGSAGGGAFPLLYFRGRLIICGYLTPETDLRVGGDDLSAGMQFYAPDNPIVRNARGEPIIPGSSLKGVMRSNLDVIYHREQLRKLRPDVEKKKYGAVICNRQDCWVCRVFGRPANHDYPEPTRLRVEDCLLDGESVKELGLEDARAVSVVRTENAILRLFGAANPRRSEYVPAGVRFAFRLLYDVYTPQDVKEGLPYVLEALHLVEDSGLGGSRSRGTGRVKFEDLRLYWKSVGHYKSGDRAGTLLAGPVDDVTELQKTCQDKLSALAKKLEEEEKEFLKGNQGA